MEVLNNTRCFNCSAFINISNNCVLIRKYSHIKMNSTYFKIKKTNTYYAVP